MSARHYIVTAPDGSPRLYGLTPAVLNNPARFQEYKEQVCLCRFEGYIITAATLPDLPVQDGDVIEEPLFSWILGPCVALECRQGASLDHDEGNQG